ncbi:hypothetical protein GCM10020000_00470 [Streptomyces olivoverticillatus]
MLLALAVDRTGTGLWASSSALYLTFVAHLSARQIGVLLGVAGVAGIAGSPLAGRLASRFPVRPLLIGCHLLRVATLGLLLVCTGFDALLPAIAVTYLGDRAAKMLEMLFATRTAGERRAAYQALSRSAANAGYALGAGIAAIGLAVGTRDAYSALILGDALSFAVAAALVWRTHEPRDGGVEVVRSDSAAAEATVGNQPSVRRANPWRDRGYLLFVLLDIPMNIDDSILGVGLPLWLVDRTSAPHALVPAFLVVNTVMVVALQISVSARAEGSRRATRAVLLYGIVLLAGCAAMAVATRGGTWMAATVLIAAALLVTLAELMRSVSSWELAVLLAPRDARAAYLGGGRDFPVHPEVGRAAAADRCGDGRRTGGMARAGDGGRRACRRAARGLRTAAADSRPAPACPPRTRGNRLGPPQQRGGREGRGDRPSPCGAHGNPSLWKVRHSGASVAGLRKEAGVVDGPVTLFNESPEDPFSVENAASAVLDRRGTVVGWGARAERLLGYRTADVIGRAAADVMVAHRDRERIAAAAQACAHANGWFGVLPVLRSDGHRVHMGLRARCVMRNGSDVEWFLVAAPRRGRRPMGDRPVRPGRALPALPDRPRRPRTRPQRPARQPRRRPHRRHGPRGRPRTPHPRLPARRGRGNGGEQTLAGARDRTPHDLHRTALPS